MFSIYHLLFTIEALSPLELDDHCGASLRGALFETIWGRYCLNKEASSCGVCPFHTNCPVSALVAPFRDERPRGHEVPRPYAIHPPHSHSGDWKRRYEPGERLTFGLTLFGNIITLFPYVGLSLNLFGKNGLGRRLQANNGRRGTFKVVEITSYNSLSSERRPVYDAATESLVTIPTLAVTEDEVKNRAMGLSNEQITLDFLTPTRIIELHNPQARPTFRTIVLRLLERVSALEEAYSHQNQQWNAELRYHLVGKAAAISCQDDARQWEMLRSYSNRQRRGMDISGFTGKVTFRGDLSPFRELLAWGELVSVGKGVVKGNGWYTISEDY